MRKAKLLLRTLGLFLGVGVLSVALWRGLMGPDEHSLEEGDFGAVAPFALTAQDGKPFSSTDLAGKVWVSDFIFTRCGGPCPRLTKAMARLQADLASEPDVRLVSFTVDPVYDTPPVLSAYAERFGADPARWRFLTGETSTVRGLILDSFKLAVQENAGPARRPGEEVTHSLHFVLVDKDARIRGYFTATDDASLDRLRRRVRELA
jgi:protein SCO1